MDTFEPNQKTKRDRTLAGADGKHVDPQKFREHFALEGADWFPERLLAVFLEEGRQGGEGGPVGDKLTLEGFRAGGAWGLRAWGGGGAVCR